MDVFALRDSLIHDYSAYISGFINIRDDRIRSHVEKELSEGLLWPQPLIQLNPAFEAGASIDELVDEGVLHDECRRIFRIKADAHDAGRLLRLHKHQDEAIRIARGGHNYVLTTGTGSGKSLAYIIPIVGAILQHGSGKGTKAIIVYPMNALANSQLGELEKFLQFGYPDGRGPATFARYTGQESEEEKNRIMASPPDILLTNYVMLELILTRPQERRTLVPAAKGLRFLVLDELHTYRGRQGADVAMLVRRVRDSLDAGRMQCVGTSATLAGSGSPREQREEVARVASQVFGAWVDPAHVIGETLARVTNESDAKSSTYVEALRERINDPQSQPPTGFEAFCADPLSSWIESAFGLMRDPTTGGLIRAKPRSIRGEDGAARELSALTQSSEQACEAALERWLLGGYQAAPNPVTMGPTFAFRLHQFISRGDTVYASLEPEQKRVVTVRGQQFVPGDRNRVLLPLVFCRACGQEYYVVRRAGDGAAEVYSFAPRELSDQHESEEGEPGYLYLSQEEPWREDPEALLEKVPDEWLEEHNGVVRVRPARRGDLPKVLLVNGVGEEDTVGIEAAYLTAPFRFCLHCGVSYDFRQRSDFAKLAALGSEGRSTATTILTLSAIRKLRDDQSLKAQARKLLSFTDNRQDAALQAGHFNDFVEVGVLRSALYRAVRAAAGQGVEHEALAQRVFDALDLPFHLYAADPAVKFAQRQETGRALREVLGYRLYHDLRRGWRITSPNLEQCGLLELHYKSLDELCGAEEEWGGMHPALVTATPDVRARVAKVLLDFMRRELAIKVSYLDALQQEQIKQLSDQRLIAPWGIDENETMEHASILFPRSRRDHDYAGNAYLSARGGFGQLLRRRATFPNHNGPLSMEETGLLIEQLLQVLSVAGLVEEVSKAESEEDVPGYQLPASAMVWHVGDGKRALSDPIRIPREPVGGRRTNPFFVDFYRETASHLVGIEAREHTAQVSNDEREDRENRFRSAALPILFCSPTMELGVDIAELNVVNMRNIPPTPANYAQRSGRAGRSGQPALVFSYSSVGSPHDQYFFKRPSLMVAGSVTAPRLDLGNEDLIRAHIYAIWLAETGAYLGTSLKDILDVASDTPTLDLQEGLKTDLASESALARARERATRHLGELRPEFKEADWYSDHWLDEVLDQRNLRFEQACDRWRSLYRAALRQQEIQNKIIKDASRSQQDKAQAVRLRREAESQMELLTESKNIAQSDFYSYRYFASEGFLPGYNFPRLPLSAYIPGRRQRTGRDEYLSRPRFLAISEFGPRAIVYHEGSRYLINRVILTFEEGEEEIATQRAKQCKDCGYLHPIANGDGPDLCERCGSRLDAPLSNLFRLRNVSTRRRERISSDEEERVRMGFEVQTGVRFAELGGQVSCRIASIEHHGNKVATLTYGQSATLWRINLGWRRRADPNRFGFVLDLERGYWAKNDLEAEGEPDDPLSSRTRRVIPYVEDRRNCLILEPAGARDPEVMASLQAALKTAIQARYQLEDSELAAEPLPSADERRSILFYEAAEGGAGALRRLLDDVDALGEISRLALDLCHFDPASGDDLHRAPTAKEDCEAACYDCLMSYTNQRDHQYLDRHLVKDFLLELAASAVRAAPAPIPRAEHYQRLVNLCGSDLESKWLALLEENNLRLPSDAQVLIEACGTRPDFLSRDHLTAIYIDGPHHLYAERAARDQAQTEAMEDLGYTVVRFTAEEDWRARIGKYPGVFGSLK
jgi:ATP-dependent helicase YprA (DUF1998 family)